MQAEVQVWDVWFTVDFEVDYNDGAEIFIEKITFDEAAAEEHGFFKEDMESKIFKDELISKLWDHLLIVKDDY